MATKAIVIVFIAIVSDRCFMVLKPEVMVTRLSRHKLGLTWPSSEKVRVEGFQCFGIIFLEAMVRFGVHSITASCIVQNSDDMPPRVRSLRGFGMRHLGDLVLQCSE